jgi:alkane 1-monooxygenase
MTPLQKLKACAYLASMMPMLLVLLGFYWGAHWLVPFFFFVELPLLRMAIGHDRVSGIRSDAVSGAWLNYLLWLPRCYTLVWLALLGWSIYVLGTSSLSPLNLFGFAVSMWIIYSLNLAVAHELVHSHHAIDRGLARILSATSGYWHFADEHRSHHATNGSAQLVDAAPMHMHVYRYAWLRYLATWRCAWDWELAAQMRQRRAAFTNRLVWWAIAPIGVLALHGFAAGLAGAIFFVTMAAGTAFSLQAITFLQHWGLAQAQTPESAIYGYAWEEGCAMQACVTLNHAFHSHHHLKPGLRYYELQAVAGAPQLPASYPVMFIVMLVPALFRRIMTRQRAAWLATHAIGGGSSEPHAGQSCLSPEKIRALLAGKPG